MNSKDYFKDIYNDFFGVDTLIPKSSEQKKETKNDIDETMISFYDEVNKLFIDNKSKDLLKKIIEYMRKYNEKLETNYVSFQMILKSNDKTTIENLVEIVSKSAAYFNYISNEVNHISLYNISDKTDFNQIFSKNGLNHIIDLKGLELFDFEKKKKFFHELEENITSNKQTIFIISGENDEIKSFFEEKYDLTTKYFTFELIGQNPDIQDLYSELLSSVSLSDDLKVSLLDYLSATYSETTNYSLYRDNLLKELSFKNKVPQLDKVKSLDEVFKDLNQLVGLTKVKKVLNDLVDLINLKEKNPDLKINNINLHMVFLGNPGTGKTTVARIVANILFNLKYIRENKLIEVSSKDLVAEYVGQTAPKTNSVIEKALGGVLFIDEAYSLANKSGNETYNAEAIATLIRAMENYRHDLVVIFAGYTKEMQDFLDSNSGIVSRIGYSLEFADYTEDELIQIFNIFMTNSGFIVTNEAIELLRRIIKENINNKNFGNARFIRNIYEKTVIKHASNTKNEKKKSILKTITQDDINTENLFL